VAGGSDGKGELVDGGGRAAAVASNGGGGKAEAVYGGGRAGAVTAGVCRSGVASVDGV